MLNFCFLPRLSGVANTCMVAICAAIVYMSTAMMPALAAEASGTYWVVGSFKVLASADKERERLERLTTEHVEMAPFYLDGRSPASATDEPAAYIDGEANIRLLVRQSTDPQEQRRALESMGLAVWPLKVNAAQVMQLKAAVDARGEILAPEHWLVLGGFHGPDRARSQRDSLHNAGIESVTIHRLEKDGRYYYRVDHGPFDRIIAAQQQRLIDQGVTDAYWLRADGAELVDVE
jgi:cell division protein FtsN